MSESRPEAAVETRRLAAIMFTDIAGFSRQMGADEARTLRLLDVHNQIIQHAVSEHHGTVIKTVGDAFLVDFPSAVHAVQCAQAIQAQFRTYNTEKAKDEQIHIRIGIHLGDVVQKDGDVFGDGVNIASRLQTLAAPDTICISHKVYEEVEKKLALGTVVSLGRTEEAIAAHRDAITRNPNLLLAHLGLASIYGELGREEEARAEAAEVLRISPTFSLEGWRQFSPQKDPVILERQLAALRKAGLR